MFSVGTRYSWTGCLGRGVSDLLTSSGGKDVNELRDGFGSERSNEFRYRECHHMVI